MNKKIYVISLIFYESAKNPYELTKTKDQRDLEVENKSAVADSDLLTFLKINKIIKMHS